jgi:hypothetical protein
MMSSYESKTLRVDIHLQPYPFSHLTIFAYLVVFLHYDFYLGYCRRWRLRWRGSSC